tara:strand:- start:68 stop:487 length:420 start_codon:yes stop_codon:yes gene_type:complete
MAKLKLYCTKCANQKVIFRDDLDNFDVSTFVCKGCKEEQYFYDLERGNVKTFAEKYLFPLTFIIKILYGKRPIANEGGINSTRTQEQYLTDFVRWFGLIGPIFFFYTLYIAKQGDIKAVLLVCVGIWGLVRLAQYVKTR